MNNLLPAEKLNQFVDDKINVLEIKNEEICNANHILDWIMQRNWTHSLEYQSWPDGEVHKVYDGLMEVFNLIQNLDASLRNIKQAYNIELHKQYTLLDNSSIKEALDALDKLNKIKEIL